MTIEFYCSTIGCKELKKRFSSHCDACDSKVNSVRQGGICCPEMKKDRGSCVCRYIATCSVHKVSEHVGTHD